MGTVWEVSDQKAKGGVINGEFYPIVDTLWDLGFRCRFFAVSCWTKFLWGRTCEVAGKYACLWGGKEHEAGGTNVHG